MNDLFIIYDHSAPINESHTSLRSNFYTQLTCIIFKIYTKLILYKTLNTVNFSILQSKFKKVQLCCNTYQNIFSLWH